MDTSVPPGAAILLDFIGSIEAPSGYDTIYGNNQGRLKVPLTRMTLGEVIAAGKSWTRRFGWSAVGRYQFMRNVDRACQGIAIAVRRRPFDSDLQDRLGHHLLKRRG